MSRGFYGLSAAPYGTDSTPSYGGFGGGFGYGPTRPLPQAAGAFNGGLLGPTAPATTSQAYGQRSQPHPPTAINPVSAAAGGTSGTGREGWQIGCDLAPCDSVLTCRRVPFCLWSLRSSDLLA